MTEENNSQNEVSEKEENVEQENRKGEEGKKEENEQKEENIQKDVKKGRKPLSLEQKYGMSCYIPFFNVVTCLITGIRKVHSPFCRFHARQGLILFGYWIVFMVLSLILSFIPYIGSILAVFLLLFILVLHFGGIFATYHNQTNKLPFVKFFLDKIPEYYIYMTFTGKVPEEKEKEDQKKAEEEEKKEEDVKETKQIDIEQEKVEEEK